MIRKIKESFVNEDDRIFITDDILRGFTFQDLVDVAHANGEDIYTAFEGMLSEAVEYAREMIEMYGVDIENNM